MVGSRHGSTALQDRRVWVFDCDGVLLDSNAAKTTAFEQVTREYGEDAGRALVAHHIENGGVSRFEKFDYFFTSILQREPEDGEMDRLLREFARLSAEGLRRARLEEHAVALLAHLKSLGSAVYVASGGQQDEVRDALSHHGIADQVDEIFGSPAPKSAIVGELMRRHASPPAALVGDSRLDVEVALELGMQPVFISQWSEDRAAVELATKEAAVSVFHDLGQLLQRLSGVVTTQRVAVPEQRR